MKQFISDFFQNLGKLIIKLINSRKTLFQIIQKILAIHIILSLKNELYIVITFALSSIADFVYFGFIEFEKVKTEVKIGN